MVKVMKHWNKLPREAAKSLLLEFFQEGITQTSVRHDSGDFALDYKDGLDLWNSLPALWLSDCDKQWWVPFLSWTC